MNRKRKCVMTRRSFTRRILLGGATLLAGVGLGAAYALAVEPSRLAVEQVCMELDHLGGGKAIRVAQLSDIHVNAQTDPGYLRRIVQLTNQLSPDIVILTGDYVTGAASYAGPCADAMAQLVAPWGKFAILGNHDIWTDAMHIAQRLEQAGYQLLRDQSASLDLPMGKLWLVGIEDTGFMSTGSFAEFQQHWSHKIPILANLLDQIPADEARLLLVHNPDFNEMLHALPINLALCGHTHGGQVRIPGLGAPVVPSCLGSKYAAGWATGPSSPVYVNRGIGTSILPIRMNCRPEITLLELCPIPVSHI